MVSNVADIVKAIQDSSGVKVVTQSAMGYTVFFPVDKDKAIEILETIGKPFDYCYDSNGFVLLG